MSKQSVTILNSGSRVRDIFGGWGLKCRAEMEEIEAAHDSIIQTGAINSNKLAHALCALDLTSHSRRRKAESSSATLRSKSITSVADTVRDRTLHLFYLRSKICIAGPGSAPYLSSEKVRAIGSGQMTKTSAPSEPQIP